MTRWRVERNSALSTFIDNFSREALGIGVDTSLPAHSTCHRRFGCESSVERGLPQEIIVDNGPEFIGKKDDPLGLQITVLRLRFIDPGKPIQNAYIESFNGRMRDECLNQKLVPQSLERRRSRVISDWKDRLQHEKTT